MDHGLTSRHVRDCNLVIFGDPGSNRILAEILDRLPVSWNMQGLEVAGKRYASDQAVPVMVFPNPLNPERYVVLNSGFTYREYDYLNNARQVPKLPDWAVIDVKSGMTSQGPGKVLDAGFFDEKWRFPKK